MSQTLVTFLLVLFVSIFIVSFCFVYSDKLKIFFSKFSNFKFFNFQKKSSKKYSKKAKGSGKNAKVKASASQFRPIVKPPEIEYKKDIPQESSLVVSKEKDSTAQNKTNIDQMQKSINSLFCFGI